MTPWSPIMHGTWKVLEAFDRARRVGRVDAEAYRVVRLGVALVVPLKLRILRGGMEAYREAPHLRGRRNAGRVG